MSSDETPVNVEGIGKMISHKGKPKYMENLSQCHFFHHRSYMENPVSEHRPPRSELGAQHLRYCTACEKYTGITLYKLSYRELLNHILVHRHVKISEPSLPV